MVGEADSLRKVSLAEGAWKDEPERRGADHAPYRSRSCHQFKASYLYVHQCGGALACPAHFLIGTSLLSTPGPGNGDDSYINQVTRENTISKLRYRQKLLDHLWNRWRREYVLELRSFHHHPSASDRSLQVGDVVFVEATGTPRSLWLLGRVTEVFPGRDGLTRTCSLKTQDGKIIKRPVQTLHFLEMEPPSSGGGRM